jgi:hypothetical protein
VREALGICLYIIAVLPAYSATALGVMAWLIPERRVRAGFAAIALIASAIAAVLVAAGLELAP